jgi:hypothetical protein
LTYSGSTPGLYVDQVTPATGPSAGGTPVTITGAGFTGASQVYFGGQAASGVTFNGATSLTATSPPAAVGTVDITVTTGAGTSTTNPADQFTSTAPVSTSQSCDPGCTATVTTPLDATTVVVAGTQGTGSSAQVNLSVETDTLACGAFDQPTAVSTLTSNGFSSGALLAVSETVGGEPSTKGVSVCYQGPAPATAAFLPRCKAGQKLKAPCVHSLQEESGSVVATFFVPANDPRFWTGDQNTVDVKSFSPTHGAPGAKVTLKGKNLNEVNAVVIGGAAAAIVTASSTKLVVKVPVQAQTGVVSLTSNAGTVTSTTPFTVPGHA